MRTRRLAAAGIDVVCWLAVPASVLPLGLALRAAGLRPAPVALNLLALVLVILPVTLWVAAREAAPGSATLGKRRCGLRVTRVTTGEPVSRVRALGRNLLKVALPWELGHTVAFRFATQPHPGAVLVGLAAATYGWVLIELIGLLSPSRRTVHDRLSGTVVVPTRWGRGPGSHVR